MNTTEKSILKLFSKLDRASQESLARQLNTQIDHSKGYLSQLLKQQEESKAVACPDCSSKNIISRGKVSGSRRFSCNDCNRTFSQTIGTVLYGIKKKEKWEHYLQCMEEGLSLRESAKRVGIGLQTAFNWRHKVLASLSELGVEKFSGIVESDETHIAYSQKGERNLDRPARRRGRDSVKGLSGKNNRVTVVVTTDRDKKEFVVAGRGGLTRNKIDKVLANKIDKSATFCTDGSQSYLGYAKRNKLDHKRIISYDKNRTLKNKAYHIQTANNYHKQIRQWLKPFNGVATKYLQNYLNWLAVQEELRNSQSRIKQWACWLVGSTGAYEYFNNLIQGANTIS